jgi:hypothetical protein
METDAFWAAEESAARVRIGKGGIVVLYDEPESSKFIALVQRLKRRQERTARQTRQTKQRLRLVLRKLRSA